MKDKKSQITDTVQFFSKITEAYLHFEQSILKLDQKIPDLSPQQLKRSCAKLREEKSKLEILDQQMFDILKLTGIAIYEKSTLDEHRVALARAKIASNNLFHKLTELKASLQEDDTELLDLEIILK